MYIYLYICFNFKFKSVLLLADEINLLLYIKT
jgi:hypothetical protein